MLGLAATAGFAILFHRIATSERVPPWPWVTGSIVLSLATLGTMGFLLWFPAQLGLFVAMWVSNAKRKSREEIWAEKREQERRLEGERMRRAQEEIQRERERRQRP